MTLPPMREEAEKLGVDFLNVLIHSPNMWWWDEKVNGLFGDPLLRELIIAQKQQPHLDHAPNRYYTNLDNYEQSAILTICGKWNRLISFYEWGNRDRAYVEHFVKTGLVPHG